MVKMSVELVAKLSRNRVKDLLHKLAEEADTIPPSRARERIPPMIREKIALFNGYVKARDVSDAFLVSQRYAHKVLTGK